MPSIIIPQADGVTITQDQTGVLTVPPAPQTQVTLPSGMSFDGTTLTVPQIKLTSGPTYPDGQYIIQLASGTETLVPYTTPIIPTPAVALQPTTLTFSIGAIANMAPGSATDRISVPCPSSVLGTNYAEAFFMYDPGPPFDIRAIALNGSILVTIWNRTSYTANLPAGNLRVVVR
jgi:hypothetical protein